MMARIRPERKGPRQNMLTDRLRSVLPQAIWGLLQDVKRTDREDKHITRAYVCGRDCACALMCGRVCARVSVSTLRTCLSRRYAMAEIPCYHWALGLANAVWTRDWTQRGRQQVTRAGAGVHVFCRGGWHGGKLAAAHALKASEFSVRFSDWPKDGPGRPL